MLSIARDHIDRRLPTDGKVRDHEHSRDLDDRRDDGVVCFRTSLIVQNDSSERKMSTCGISWVPTLCHANLLGIKKTPANRAY